MKIKAIAVKALEKYKLELSFNDGTVGVYDVSSLSVTTVFQQWHKDDTFFKVFIHPDHNSIAWSDEMEIDTLTAYLEIKGISYEQYTIQNRDLSYARR